MDTIKEARSGTMPENLQEILDASVSAKQALVGGQNQYELPPAFASFFAALLPATPECILDPQCASGNLVREGIPYWVRKLGFEIDRRFEGVDDGVHRVIGNCVDVWEAITDLFPEMRFECQVANPPFGVRWRTPTGNCDSSEYTWDRMMSLASPAGYGYFVSNHKTIERLGLHRDRRVLLYQVFPAGIWPRCEVEIGVVHFDNSPLRPPREEVRYTTLDLSEHAETAARIKAHYQAHQEDRTQGASDWSDIYGAILKIREVLAEEHANRKPWNVWLDQSGMLRIYLSTRTQVKRKLTREDVLRMGRVNKAHPYSLAVEKETRLLLNELVSCGFYSIEAKAKAAITSALADVNRAACPLMPPTVFGSVAYADEEDTLLCRADLVNPDGQRLFTQGQKYPIDTASYRFTEQFTRNKPHFDDENGGMTTLVHQCTRTGTDRYIAIRDNLGHRHRFMDKPQDEQGYDHSEDTLIATFQIPQVQTVAEVYQEQYERNLRCLSTCEMLADFKFYPGQLSYLARVGVRDYGVVAAATGAGKTLFAISLIQMKGPKRALIIAPQGTMKAAKCDEDDDDDVQAPEVHASQWLAELNRFAAGIPVFQIFNRADYDRILELNDGVLPEGAIYVTYYQALFSNGARETAPESWDDARLERECQQILGAKVKLPAPPEATLSIQYWCDSVGHEKDGIRCIVRPCLATEIGSQFDAVLLDEGHICCNLDAQVTQMLIRLQPRYRYVLSATPLPNVITNLFSLMGWVAVPDWYKGGRRNSAWPYAREDIARFQETFLVLERDLTQERLNEAVARRAGNLNYRGSRCEKPSPIISSPARLLKILSPNMAYISKAMCNPDYREPKLVDVRVPMGQEQTELYVWFMHRGNIAGKNPLVRARKQITYLRNICADPAGFTHGGPRESSNFNPKQVAILELVRDIVNRGEQVVVVCARKGQTNSLQAALRDARVLVSRIDSTIPADQHSRQSNLFKAKRTQVMLMGMKCAVAHSFSECPNMVIGSLEYSWGSLDQARGRIDRVNSKCDRMIYCVLHQHSIEEIIFDTVGTKSDSSAICLQGKRVPRDFKPVDMSEVLAQAITDFKDTGMDERQCEAQWPRLRDSFSANAFNKSR